MHDDAHRIAWAHYEGEECSRNSVDEMEVQINAAICDAVNKAIATERERCARLVEGGSPMSTMKQTLEWLAREIREGTK